MFVTNSTIKQLITLSSSVYLITYSSHCAEHTIAITYVPTFRSFWSLSIFRSEARESSRKSTEKRRRRAERSRWMHKRCLRCHNTTYLRSFAVREPNWTQFNIHFPKCRPTKINWKLFQLNALDEGDKATAMNIFRFWKWGTYFPLALRTAHVRTAVWFFFHNQKGENAESESENVKLGENVNDHRAKSENSLELWKNFRKNGLWIFFFK